MTELLAPAGDMEKLEWAIAYGADAVYFGMKDFSLRSFAGNFDIEEADKAIKLLHQKGKKGYITLNIYPYSNEYDEIIKTARNLEDIETDALIVSDLGLLSLLKKNKIKTPIHISTQANTMSYQTVLAYKELGAKRVNLARELSFEQIKEIQKNLKSEVETEVFIHGAVCFSYSGRCAISDYMTGRKANRGECTHPCRWKYALVEETRDGQYYPIFEDNRGSYFFNSKDLALFPFVKELMNSGVNSFKIEGRMKTIHYIASVVSLYRRIMDGENISVDEGFRLLSRVSNRGYSYGFIKGGVKPEDYSQEENNTHSTSTFVAIYSENTKEGTILKIRNRIFAGDKLEVLTPGGIIKEIQMPTPLTRKDGTRMDVVQNGDEIIIQEKIIPYSLFRRVKEEL
ncbi:MAG: U32 family peptidase [Proteobacteria bacterium]|nr:U32 family peptidase [Pseudomonadota bacterium]